MNDSDPQTSLSQVPIAFGAVEVRPINAQIVLMINRRSGAQGVVSVDVAGALGRCREFRTSRQHARIIAGPGASEEALTDIAGTLEELARQGVLLRADDILEEIVQGKASGNKPTRVFIVTADRPAAVERLLDSMLHAGGLTRFDALFLVDDSCEQQNRAANEELLASFNTRSAQEFYYLGQQQQAAFAESLKNALGPVEGPHPVDAALAADQWGGAATYGRARNFCLLLSVGCKALVLDDDILCRGYDFLEVVHLPRFDSAAVSSAYFAADYEAATARLKPREEAVLATVERFVGISTGEALRELSSPLPSVVSLLDCSGDVAAALGKDSQVLITQVGSVGDPGTEGASWLTSLDPESQARFVDALKAAEGGAVPRCCWRGVSAASFVSMGSMSQLTGLDNTAVLPPYFPAYRGEDLLFAGMTKLLYPSSTALELPLCVPHLPLDVRPPILLETTDKQSLTLGVAFQFVARQLNLPRYDTPVETLRSFGEALTELAARDDTDLLILLRSLTAESSVAQMERLREASPASEPGAGWNEYLRASHEALERSLQTQVTGSPAASDQDMPFSLDQLRAVTREFSAVMRHWVDMRQAAVSAYASALYQP